MTHLTETDVELSEPVDVLSGDVDREGDCIYRSNEAQRGYTFTANGLVVASALRSGHKIHVA